MKKFFFLLFCCLLSISLWAQQNNISSFYLSNGMKVLLCEDHAQPKIYGAVCVHVGGKNDPADNTGMAHYFEHIMFKGTDQIGTLDWKSEKVYLDSISMCYDQLHGTTDEAKRKVILMKINDLNNTATQYAIPNEVDVILSKMGGEGVNAFTSNDVTVYHNMFPSNQLEKWLTVYSERFRNPVFRLFQTELEAVYEEYNMYHDEPTGVFMEDALAAAFGSHPYGRPVIGYQQHLKNPQTSAMQKFYNTYYHPNNMTLILVGDFDANALQPLLEKTIGHLHNEGDGVSHDLAYNTQRMKTDVNMPIKPFVGHQIETVKETPVKMGVIGFQTVGAREQDALYLDMFSGLLNNSSQTGLLDELNTNHKVLFAGAANYNMLEAGMFVYIYAPKIIGQSHEDAEKMIFAAIDSLRTGHFSDNLFDAVKMDYLKEYVRNMESLENKFNVVLGLEMNGLEPKDYYKREEMIRNMTKEDIIRVAKTYFNDNCLIFRSNMGTKHQEKLQKPNWKSIVAKNTEAQSVFAKKIEQMQVRDIKPQVIDFERDIIEMPINESYDLYCSPNPYNDIFSINIVYNYGIIKDPALNEAVQYVALQGTQSTSFKDFQLQLQKLGASINIYCGDNQLYVFISGFDKDLETIVELCRNKIYFPGNDETKLKLLEDNMASSIKMNKNDASQWGIALYSYARYGQNSSYLRRTSLKEMKSYTGKDLLQIFAKAVNYDGYVTYVGNRNFNDVASLFKSVYQLNPSAVPGNKPVRQLQQYDKPTVFLASNKKFLQSNIYFYILGNPLDKKAWMPCEAYNEYMGGSMAGVVFQEIRELRSLGYSAYGAYSYDHLNRRPGYAFGYLGTQSDKTIDGCKAMSDLFIQFPDKPEKFEMAKTSLIHKNEAEYITFRNLPGVIHDWKEEGYFNDPRPEQLHQIIEMRYDDVKEFYNQNIGNRPLIITIAGDKNRIDMNELKKMGKVVKVKYKDMITE